MKGLEKWIICFFITNQSFDDIFPFRLVKLIQF